MAFKFDQLVSAEKTRLSHGPAVVNQPGTGAILFGRGMPDPARYPLESLGRHFDDLLKHHAASALSYEVGPALPELARALAEHHRRRDGVAVGTDQIVATNGTAGGMTLIANLFIQPGDVVITEELSYWGAIRTFRLAGADIHTVPMDGQGMRVDLLPSLLDELQSAGKRVKFIYTIANCHSPTGTVLPEVRRVVLAREASRRGIALVQDDTYGEIRFEDFPPPLLALAPDCSLHLGSFSKTIAPGLRLGWITAPAPVAALLTQSRTDLGNSPLIQHAVARLMESGEYRRAATQAGPHYREKRDVMIAALEEFCAPQCSWQVPKGGFFLWLTMAQGDVTSLMPIAAEEGVNFMVGPDFSPRRQATQQFRLSYSDPSREQIREGIKRLGRALDRLARGGARR